MSEPKWTPGPWTTVPDKHRSWICGVGHNRDDPQIWSERIAQESEAYIYGDKIADAQLIAAAPELFDALCEAARLLSVFVREDSDAIAAAVLQQARAALSKAQGES